MLQYLDDRTAARAIANLGRLTRGVLYLSALTTRDWRENCDRTRTDRDVFLRDAAWYGTRLRKHFRPERRRVLGPPRRAAHHLGNGNRRNLSRARYASRACPIPSFPSMPPAAMPATATCAPQVFAAVPQRRASLGKRLFWRFVLFVAQFPGGPAPAEAPAR